jgi:aminopeptidase N
VTILNDWREHYQQTYANLKDYQMPEMPLSELGPFDIQREILYNKGAFVLHMIRQFIGDHNFILYLQHFIAKYSYQKTTIRDFTGLGVELYGARLVDVFRQWVYSAGTYDITIQDVKVRPFRGKYQVTVELTNSGQLNLPDTVDMEITTNSKVYNDILSFKGLNVTIQKTLTEPPEKITVNARNDILEPNMDDNTWRYHP